MNVNMLLNQLGQRLDGLCQQLFDHYHSPKDEPEILAKVYGSASAVSWPQLQSDLLAIHQEYVAVWQQQERQNRLQNFYEWIQPHGGINKARQIVAKASRPELEPIIDAADQPVSFEKLPVKLNKNLDDVLDLLEQLRTLLRP